jgi:putative membrane protein
MEYFYLKALHLVGVVTWFSGLFYAGRLLIYMREAQDFVEPNRSILTDQLQLMLRRLWFGIAWPSAIFTLVVGFWLLSRYGSFPNWLLLKLGLLVGLYAYHLSIHRIRRQQVERDFRHSALALRIWNEVPTLFLVSIVFLAVVKDGLGIGAGLVGLLVLVFLLAAGLVIYRRVRERSSD